MGRVKSVKLGLEWSGVGLTYYLWSGNPPDVCVSSVRLDHLSHNFTRLAAPIKVHDNVMDQLCEQDQYINPISHHKYKHIIYNCGYL